MCPRNSREAGMRAGGHVHQGEGSGSWDPRGGQGQFVECGGTLEGPYGAESQRVAGFV